MIMVSVAKEGIADTCGFCGKPIRPGTVFALKRFRLKNGGFGWVFAHLACDSYSRGARPVRVRDTSGASRKH